MIFRLGHGGLSLISRLIFMTCSHKWVLYILFYPVYSERLKVTYKVWTVQQNIQEVICQRLTKRRQNNKLTLKNLHGIQVVAVITSHQNINDKKCTDLQNSKYPQDGETNELLEECYSRVSSLNFFGYLGGGHRWWESSILTPSLNGHCYAVRSYFFYNPWNYDYAPQVYDSKRKSHKNSKECPLIEFQTPKGKI